MESSAQQTSTLLLRMEDEYTSDSAFIHAYNTNIHKGRYTLLRIGAILPDVRNYSIVIGTWGQCIDGSILRPKNNIYTNTNSSGGRDGSFQTRLKLEATAMKSMMELLEMMEEDLYENFTSSSSSPPSGNNLSSSPPPIPIPPQRKRPPPDRMCYNTILSAMSRQVNPSLYEMRLVLQRMMERVKFELERSVIMDDDVDMDNNGTNDDSSSTDIANQMMYDYAMTFFPDVFSYNALIEARANRSAMFASSSSSSSSTSFKNTKKQHSVSAPKQQQQQQHQFITNRLQHLSAWQQHGNNENQLHNRKRRFTASEEEAILAEQIVDEMRHLATVTVRPNIYSYNGKRVLLLFFLILCIIIISNFGISTYTHALTTFFSRDKGMDKDG
jgi:hypothetical protein